MKEFEKVAGPPSSILRIEYETSIKDAPYRFQFDTQRYQQLLREDLGFTDEILSQLSVRAMNSRGWRSSVVAGTYNPLTKRILLKPGILFRHNHIYTANKDLLENLMHESSHAAQHLVEGNSPIMPQKLAITGIATAVGLGEYMLLNQPGLDYSEPAAIATMFAVDHIGQRIFYRRDPSEVQARTFQSNPEARAKWEGVISITARLPD